MDIKRAIKKNWLTILLLIFVSVITFNADAKSWVLTKLVRTGLFNPDINKTAINASAADIGFTKADGSKLILTDLKGKVVFINFWATWCPPCRAEMPTINALYKKVKDQKDIVFLMVNLENDLPKATKYMKDNDFDLPVYVANSEIPAELLSGGIPTTVIINSKGNIVLKHEGMADYDTPKMIPFLKAQL